MLLHSEISNENLHQVEEKLQRFVKDYQIFYGKTRMTMNVHSVTHLVDCVKNMGPLWTYSMFHFESYNGTLKAFGENSVNAVNQIVEKMVAQNTKLNKPMKVTTENSVHLNNEIAQPSMDSKEKMAMESRPITECRFYTSFTQGPVIHIHFAALHKGVQNYGLFYIYFGWHSWNGEVLFQT